MSKILKKIEQALLDIMAKYDVNAAKREVLRALLAECTEAQREKFSRSFPEVPGACIDDAIRICERTVAKNREPADTAGDMFRTVPDPKTLPRCRWRRKGYCIKAKMDVSGHNTQYRRCWTVLRSGNCPEGKKARE